MKGLLLTNIIFQHFDNNTRLDRMIKKIDYGSDVLKQAEVHFCMATRAKPSRH
ncbi:MAG: hypothetical protein IPL98_01805 [Saprospiraceae bacterium]|nr:hypothetical protein [Saprospiraceae bacterium]